MFGLNRHRMRSDVEDEGQREGEGGAGAGDSGASRMSLGALFARPAATSSARRVNLSSALAMEADMDTVHMGLSSVDRDTDPTLRGPGRSHGTARAKPTGRKTSLAAYVRLVITMAMNASWTAVLFVSCVAYLLINVCFGLLYYAERQGRGIGNSQAARDEEGAGTFADAFWFSVSTFSTVGYGNLHPTSTWANSLVFIESFCGLVVVALATGLFFQKFARPSARVEFANYLCVNDLNGQKTLMVRFANLRTHELYDAKLQIACLISDDTETASTETGASGRNSSRPAAAATRRRGARLVALPLVNPHPSILLASYTIMHKITPDSPFYGLDATSLPRKVRRIGVLLEAIDSQIVQTVLAHRLYSSDAVRFDVQYKNMIERREHGVRVDLHQLSEVEPCVQPPQPACAPPV